MRGSGCRREPGVYRMIGGDGEVLYVGKAKSLKNRVGQYAQGRGHTNAIYRMIHQTVSLEVIVTATETEALLLETNMIKRLRPRYNVLMRDDKSFPFIAIRTDHADPGAAKASRRQEFQRQVLRAVRQRGRRQPHAQHAAEGVPAALVFGLHLQRPHAAVHALSDQALLGAVHGAGERGGVCGAGEG